LPVATNVLECRSELEKTAPATSPGSGASSMGGRFVGGATAPEQPPAHRAAVLGIVGAVAFFAIREAGRCVTPDSGVRPGGSDGLVQPGKMWRRCDA
jgi:hypothetical protein